MTISTEEGDTEWEEINDGARCFQPQELWTMKKLACQALMLRMYQEMIKNVQILDYMAFASEENLTPSKIGKAMNWARECVLHQRSRGLILAGTGAVRKLQLQMKLPRKRAKKVDKTLMPYIALVLSICGFLSYILDPTELIQDWGMKIAPSSRYLEIWMNPPLTVYAKIYIFNVTNPEAFLAGREKLRLQEIGPFVYIESLTNNNVTFGNGTMSYIPRRTVKFQRDMSVADPSIMRVMVPNIALLGLGSMMADASFATNWVFLSSTKMQGWKPFLNLTVQEYFWGYEDPLVGLANTFASNWIPFSKLGILDRMYDEGENIITIRLDDNGLPMNDPGYLHKYSIVTWDGSPGLVNWGYDDYTFKNREEPLKPEPTERCKLIRGATEGILFPRNLDPAMPIYAYRKTFCRTTPVEFKHRDSYLPGIVGHWYGLPDDVFETPEKNLEQQCYCDPQVKQCMPSGLSDITPCYWNIPAAVSFPHFYKGDPRLVEAIDGLKPDKEKHSSFAVIQPDLGSVIDFSSRMQTNLVMRNIQYNSELIPFANMSLPFFWCELVSGGLTTDVKISLYALLVILPASQTVSILLGLLSYVYLMAAALRWLCRRYCLQEARSINEPTVQTVIVPPIPQLIMPD